ncbi:MAG: hypothetical protein AVDCRST_MAG02-1822, partial [uncultured Rubrobacteraceae bacterium]
DDRPSGWPARGRPENLPRPSGLPEPTDRTGLRLARPHRQPLRPALPGRLPLRTPPRRRPRHAPLVRRPRLRRGPGLRWPPPLLQGRCRRAGTLPLFLPVGEPGGGRKGRRRQETRAGGGHHGQDVRLLRSGALRVDGRGGWRQASLSSPL